LAPKPSTEHCNRDPRGKKRKSPERERETTGVGMFKKPPSVKNLSVLRSSDRKKIVQQIIQSYHLEEVDAETKKLLLPDGAQVQNNRISKFYFIMLILDSLQSSQRISMSLVYSTTMQKELTHYG
jgi:hypothetical protein